MKFEKQAEYRPEAVILKSYRRTAVASPLRPTLQFKQDYDMSFCGIS